MPPPLDRWPTALPLPPATAAQERRLLLASAPRSYRPRLPLPLILQYAAASMWTPKSQPFARLCATIAMLTGYLAPRRGPR